ncbi:uroporphyrinogen-III synthase [Undibacterium sp. FT31W]|uniref:Uroporphyrinogen-III synthase n=1 Tax=Undibacterium griseum TaxID=2762295 RepID=A0ABR6YMA7_9BURK|nr:uroporphyrinogen-III synthase [Undibacterium griseum]
MSYRPVIITRPRIQALEFAEKLKRLQRQAVIFPLLDISPLTDQSEIIRIAGLLTDFDLVAFVSPNAIDGFFPHVAAWPAGLPIAVVGEGSCRALEKHGLNHQNADIRKPGNSDRTDSEALMAEMDTTSLAGQKVLVVRGSRGREFLADAFRNHGADVVQLVAYSSSEPEFTIQCADQLRHLLNMDSDWVITSSEAVRTLMRWTEKLDYGKYVSKMQHQNLIVSHARIAETATALGFRNITLTGTGDENVLVALQSRV